MHRFWRRAVIAVSSVLLLLILGLWVDSYFTPRRVGLSAKGPETWSLNAGLGTISLQNSIYPDPTLNPKNARVVGSEFWGFSSFSNYSIDNPRPGQANVVPIYGSYRFYTVPFWFAAMLVGTPAVLLLPGHVKDRRRMRRARAGCCLTCGYDLTGNESGVCPECGVKIEQKKP